MTYCVSLLIAYLFIVVLYDDFFGCLILFSPIVIIMFPMMLDGLTPLSGWGIYLVLFLVGVFTKNRRISTYIYLIFIMLLIANITGCVIGSSDACDFSGMN